MPHTCSDRYSSASTQATGGSMTKKKRRIILAGACVLLFPCAGYGQNQPSTTYVPITMQQAVDLARAKNPSLLSAQQSLLSVKAQEIQAGVRANPYFTFAGTNVTLPAEGAANPYQYSLQVSRLFERGEKRRWRLDSARSTPAQTDAQYHAQEQQTILSVRQAFTSSVIAKAAKKLADDNLNDFKHELDIDRERLKAGDLAKLDFERLDLQLAQFESDESNAITNAQQASVQLQVLLGYDKPRKDFDVAGDVVPPGVSGTIVDLEQ